MREIYAAQIYTNGIADRALRRVREVTSSVLVPSGLQESGQKEGSVLAIAISERPCYSPYEGPISLLGAEEKSFRYQQEDQGRVHQFGTEVLPGMIPLELGEIWTGDLLIVEPEGLKTMPPSENHVKRFKSKELEIRRRISEFVFP